MKVVITGYGSCSPAGNTKELWNKSLAKQSCLSEYENNAIKDCPVKVVGKVSMNLAGIYPKRMEAAISRHTLLASFALKECLDNFDVGEIQSNKTGLIFGSASHGLDKIEEVIQNVIHKPFSEINKNLVASISNGGACSIIASHFKLNGFVHAVEGASSSGMLTVITGYNLIKSQMCDKVFCVSGESNLYPPAFLFYDKKIIIKGKKISFYGDVEHSEKRNTNDFVKPFSKIEISERGAIAEGAGALMIESADSALSRNAKIIAEIEDASFFFHADNFIGSDKELLGLKTLLEKYSKMTFDSIYLPITGCYALDQSLSIACSKYFPGTHTFTVEPIIGHTGASSSLLNIILGIMSLNNNTLLPTQNFIIKNIDKLLKIKPSDKPIKKRGLSRILVLSAGWGGYNGACVIKKYED